MLKDCNDPQPTIELHPKSKECTHNIIHRGTVALAPQRGEEGGARRTLNLRILVPPRRSTQLPTPAPPQASASLRGAYTQLTLLVGLKAFFTPSKKKQLVWVWGCAGALGSRGQSCNKGSRLPAAHSRRGGPGSRQPIARLSGGRAHRP